jgi:hypothetical protein
MKIKTLDNMTCKHYDDFALAFLNNPSAERRAIIANSDPLRQEIMENALGILCERAFTLREGLRLRRLAAKHGVMSLGGRLDAYGRVNTVRQLLGHGLLGGRCFGVCVQVDDVWPAPVEVKPERYKQTVALPHERALKRAEKRFRAKKR